MTRNELVDEIIESRALWEDAVKGLNDKEFETAEISRGWNVKDVYGHLATYLRLNVRHLESYKKRRKLASMRARNWYQFNKREVGRLKGMPLAKMRKEFDSAYKELLAILSQLDDQDLRTGFPTPWSRDSARRVRLGTILRADVSRHLREHARDVRKWKASEDR